MKLIIYILTIVQLVSASADEYWHLDEFLKENPRQVKILNDFEKLIKSDAQEITIKQKKRVKIALIYPNSQVSDYWRRNISALKKRLTESKIDYELNLIPAPTGEGLNKSSKEIIEAIKEKPDYLIFTLNINEHSKLVNQILNYSSIKVILLNITTPLKSWGKNQPFFYVGFDHEIGTQILIDDIKRKLPNGGDFLVLYHSQGYVSTMRGDYAIKQLVKDKKWNLVSRYYTDGSGANTEVALKDFFKKNKKVDLVISCSTDISLAASKFKKESSFLLNGWGGGTAELDSIKNGVEGIDLTVMRMNDDSAIATAEAIRLDLQGDSEEVPLVFSGEMVLIDKQTTQQKIESLEEKAFRYSNEAK
ncbi:substrate-binding domain-containing protein [Halobacteriovorax sp.]|uniref:substrate-binding domain-containing protein n=1 Tax=Halobacteriovorax sp. TaxID=2020862 RepID=UPI003563F1D3